MLKHISLNNYRNLSLEVELDPHSNLIVAPNGSGKSNFLEAIYMLALGKSFTPMSTLVELIGPNEQFAKVGAWFDNQNLQAVTSKTQRLSRRYYANDKVTTIKKVQGLVPVVLFAPHSVDLVSQDPTGRRADLDDFLSQIDGEYAHNLERYNKVLKNRNAVLKHIRDHRASTAELTYWTRELARLAISIFERRIEFFDEVSALVPKFAQKIYKYEGPEFGIQYFPKFELEGDYSATLLKKLEQNNEKEIFAGQTLYGPHKDDYRMMLNNQDLRYLGSRGQQRIAIFIWKLAQHAYWSQNSRRKAVLLLDDLMSELDKDHRATVGNFLLTHKDIQFVLTAVDENDVPEKMAKESYRIDINGQLT